nr:LPD7 domain-containing protein [uncultured Ralstonia sp.]
MREGSFWKFDGKDKTPGLDGKPHFADAGPKLTTASDDRKTIADMVAVAKAKNWGAITATGSDEFRRNTWLEGRLQGVEVKGYAPLEADLALLDAAKREREGLRISAGEAPKPDAGGNTIAVETAKAAPVPAADAWERASVKDVRTALDKTLATFPENVRRELTMRMNARLKAGVEVQQQHAKAGAPKAALGEAISARFGELKTVWDAPAQGTPAADAAQPTQAAAQVTAQAAPKVGI